MKRTLAIIMTLIIMLGIMPAQTEAACSTPACVKRAALTAMDESDTDICFVVKTGKNGKGTGYFMYRTCKGNVKCDRSGAVIVGKSTKVCKSKHYFFLRNRSIEKKVESWKTGKVSYRWRYTSIIDCVEEAACIKAHSYIEYKPCSGSWKTCKGTSKNVDGIAMCKEFAHYLWSMADDGCPVVFM